VTAEYSKGLPSSVTVGQLNRTVRPLQVPPVRIVHLGLGAFHRSHQVWYTHQASDASDWGIASFTGRRPGAAMALAEQDGLYTVVERGDAGDTFTLVGSIVDAVDGADVDRLVELVAARATAVITLTITEAAYPFGANGQFDRTAPGVESDLALLAAGSRKPATPIGRLTLALAARRAAGAGRLALVCCDNLANNGTIAGATLTGMAAAWDTDLARWIDANISFVSTSVDRITPRTTKADLAAVEAACGYRDNSPVVTEPYSNWVLSGDFPAGRPRWEDAGALFVNDIEPFENRKLWLLNGAHSLLSYAGQLRGHITVAQALADPVCRQAVEAFWDEAEAILPAGELQVPAYRDALLARFSNARITHHLTQIAMDGSTKLRMRAVPVLQAERAAGRSGAGAALIIAAWIDYAATSGQLQDAQADAMDRANLLAGTKRIRALIRLLDPALAADEEAVQLVESLQGKFPRITSSTHLSDLCANP